MDSLHTVLRSIQGNHKAETKAGAIISTCFANS